MGALEYLVLARPDLLSRCGRNTSKFFGKLTVPV